MTIPAGMNKIVITTEIGTSGSTSKNFTVVLIGPPFHQLGGVFI